MEIRVGDILTLKKRAPVRLEPHGGRSGLGRISSWNVLVAGMKLCRLATKSKKA
jgi:hypothetical protein